MTKTELIHDLMAVSDTTAVAAQIFQSIMAPLQAAAPPATWDQAISLVVGQAIPAMMQASAAVYEAHFTIEELEELVARATSPLGRKATAIRPAIEAACGQAMAAYIPQLEAALSAEITATASTGGPA